MKVFISHAQEDREFAQDIARRLSDAGIDVWLDTETLPGENYARKLGEALDASDAMVVIVSPASAESRFVKEEISYAVGSPKYAGRLIPVVVEDTDKMPWVLRRMQAIRVGQDLDQLGRKIVERLQQPVN